MTARHLWAVSYTSEIGGVTIPGVRPCGSKPEGVDVLEGLSRHHLPAVLAYSLDGKTWHRELIKTTDTPASGAPRGARTGAMKTLNGAT